MNDPLDRDLPRSPRVDTLPGDVPPPPGLEARVLAALGASGAVRPARPRPAPLRRLAAAGLLLAMGAGAGAWWSRPAADPRPAYLLLLYPGRTTRPSASEVSATVGEYAAWAGRLRAAGRRVSGERLATGAAVIPAGAPLADGDLEGYFLVTAASLDDARRLAAESPHAARGGTVVVRAIDTPR